jgi:NAD(P)-dependent dehydrogenase (short-subunit alcohol dehydrogenase family)
LIERFNFSFGPTLSGSRFVKSTGGTTLGWRRWRFVNGRGLRLCCPGAYGCNHFHEHGERYAEEQKAVIVGGTSGIGLAAAIELCRAGAQVWVTGRTADKATAAAAAIGDRATGRAVDARDAVKLQAFFARVGEFDHLIVALGGGSAIGAFKDLDEVKMRAGFDNKFWPYLNAIRMGVGQIRGSGSITLITGAAGRRAIKGTSGLAAVNGALRAIIGPLALEFAPIRVNAVSPGLIATPFWDRMPEDARRAMYERSAASVPVGVMSVMPSCSLLAMNSRQALFLTATVAPDWCRAG